MIRKIKSGLCSKLAGLHLSASCEKKKTTTFWQSLNYTNLYNHKAVYLYSLVAQNETVLPVRAWGPGQGPL